VHYSCDGAPSLLTVDAVFFAVGWPGNADTLRAPEVGIRTRRGYIEVGPDLRSNLPHVLAAGDVNGISMLVPSARYEAGSPPRTRCSAPTAPAATRPSQPAASPTQSSVGLG
jgi:pyruvate/2-oxoglutarate dehydrogenase complex dihydrolipoamide dehydrogenase (E3) component